MTGFPSLMADLLCFISEECPTVSVHQTVKADFDADAVWPPTEEQVNKSALNVCMRILEQIALSETRGNEATPKPSGQDNGHLDAGLGARAPL